MEYSIKLLAEKYEEYISKNDFDVAHKMSHHCDLATYNEYQYIDMMKRFDQLYYHADSLDITEKFLKGD